ncbi:MAG: hypothetical protein ACREN6_08645 [Gemmatimonadaceae bacterium]
MTLPKSIIAGATLALLPVLAACQADRPAGTGPYAREVAAAIPAIEKSVGLKFKTPPKVESKSKDEVRAFLEKKFDEDLPALELAGAEQSYKLLGLIPDTLNLRKFMLRLLTEQVAGYYDPETKVLYVVGTEGTGPGAVTPEMIAVTITHELVHALQDQYFPLDSLEKEHGDNDRASAVQAVIEGEAVYEQMSAMLGGKTVAMAFPGGWDRMRQMIRDAQATMPVFATAPMFIQETLLFPYLSGAEFVRHFKEKRPGQLPFRPAPTSTKQVMYPDKFLDSLDVPTRVELPKPESGSVVYENDLGAFETRLYLFQHLGDAGIAARGAAGWEGDHYEVVKTPQGAGITWLTVWDSAIDAAQFRDLMEQTIEARFKTGHGTGGNGATRKFAGKGRSLELSAVIVQGKPAVLFTDVPAGATTHLIDVAKVKLMKP